MHTLPGVRSALRAALCCLLAGTAPAHALPPDWVAVDPAVLDDMRGGFTTASGLDLSLGIERVVSINGEVVSRSTLEVSDIGRMNAEQARQTGAALSAVKLIQNGDAKLMLADFADSALGGTVIQNTLSDQRIDSRTTINATVNSLSLFTGTNFNGNVSDAIARAAGPF